MQFYHSKYCQAIISVKLLSNYVKLLIFGFSMKNCIYVTAILLQIHNNTKIYYKSIILGEKVLPDIVLFLLLLNFNYFFIEFKGVNRP